MGTDLRTLALHAQIDNDFTIILSEGISTIIQVFISILRIYVKI